MNLLYVHLEKITIYNNLPANEADNICTTAVSGFNIELRNFFD